MYLLRILCTFIFVHAVLIIRLENCPNMFSLFNHSNLLMQEKLKLRRQQVASKKAKLLSGDPLMLDSTDSLSANNSPQSETSPVVEQEGVQPKRSHSGEEKR